MTPERWRQVCALFAAALRCAPAEREVLLREVGAGHPELQTEVDRLLAGDARADEEGFLRVPDAPGSTQDLGCDRFEATWRAGDRPQIAVNPPPEIPGYEILSELGRGGMAVVYKARQLRLNRLCALKMILPGGLAGAAAPRPPPGRGRDHRQDSAPQYRSDLRTWRPRRSALLRDGVRRWRDARRSARRHPLVSLEVGEPG